jgi:phosphatidylinositol alpha-1,6-mannosyltransferase
VKEGCKYLVTASRLVEKNALDDVIKALPLLDAHINFIIVGGGPLEPELKKLVHELKVSERVIFIGQIERSEVPKYRKIADIFVRPSRSEGLGNAMISAMAAHLPVIATQEGGIAEFLFDEKRNPDKIATGWAVDKNSPEQIAEAVKEILANPEKVKKITDNAYNLVSEKYRWEKIAKDMREKVFGRVL